VRKARFKTGVLFLLTAVGVMAQGPPSPVGVTEAKSYDMRQRIELTGTVESRAISLVAGEVYGIVAEILVQEGSAVSEGDPLLSLLTERYKIALRETEAQLKEAKAGQELARNRLERARELYDKKVYSDQELENALFDFQGREGGVERLQALVDQRRLDLKRAIYRAPFDGVVTAKLTERGNWLQAGEPAFEVASLDALEITVALPEQYYARVAPGDLAEVRFDALPNVQVEGAVSAIVPRASEARTLPVKIAVANPDRAIPIGVLARVAFTSVASRATVIVPKDAIVPQGEGKQVFIVDDQQRALPVPVRLGMGAGVWVEVIGDIKPGQQVVTLGNERLFPGQTVVAQKRDYDLP